MDSAESSIRLVHLGAGWFRLTEPETCRMTTRLPEGLETLRTRIVETTRGRIGALLDPRDHERTDHPFGSWWTAGLAAIILLIFLASSDSTRTARYAFGDLFAMFIPAADRLGQALAQGRIPFWNPEVGCGIDQFGTTHGAVCYPPMWVYAVLPVRAGMAVLVVLHLTIAATGMFRWLTSLGVTGGASLLGVSALLFGLVGESWWPPLLYTIAWVPWILALIDAPGVRRRGRWCALAGCFAMQMLAGFPQYVVYGSMLVFGYVLLKAGVERSAGIVLYVSGAMVLALALAGVQLVPSFLYMRQTWRPGRLSPDEVHYLDFATGSSLKEVGKHATVILKNTVVNAQACRNLSYRKSFGYLGLFVPLAACAALLRRPSWRVGYFLAATVAGLYLSLGYAPESAAIYGYLGRWLPLFGSFRTPDRLLLWSLVGISVLAGFGADRLWTDPPNRRNSTTTLFLCICLLILRAAVWFGEGGNPFGTLLWILALVWVMANCFLSAIWELVEAARPGLVGKVRGGGSIAFALCLTGVDLWLACPQVCPYFDAPSPYSEKLRVAGQDALEPAQLQAVRDAAGFDRIYIAGLYSPIMRDSRLPAFRTLGYYETNEPARNFLLYNAALAPHEEPRCRGVTYYNLPPVPHLRLFDWSSVRFLVQMGPLADAEAHGWRDRGMFPTGARLYENDRVVPRASLWDDYRVAGPRDSLREMTSIEPPGPATAPVLENQPSRAWRDAKARHAPAGASGSLRLVRFLTDEPEHLALSVQVDRPALLLLSDTYLAGWRCWVDGLPAKIIRSNYTHRAVEVLPGTHVVEFRYRTVGFEAGLGLTAFGLLTVLAVLFPATLRRRGSGPPSIAGFALAPIRTPHQRRMAAPMTPSQAQRPDAGSS